MNERSAVDEGDPISPEEWEEMRRRQIESDKLWTGGEALPPIDSGGVLGTVQRLARGLRQAVKQRQGQRTLDASTANNLSRDLREFCGQATTRPAVLCSLNSITSELASICGPKSSFARCRAAVVPVVERFVRDSGRKFYVRLLRDLRDPRDVSCGQLADSGPFRSEPDKFLRSLRNFRESLDSPRTSQAGIAVGTRQIAAVEKLMDECRSLSRQHGPAFSAFRVRPLLFGGQKCDTVRLADAIHDLPAGVLRDLAVTFEALAAAQALNRPLGKPKQLATEKPKRSHRVSKHDAVLKFSDEKRPEGWSDKDVIAHWKRKNPGSNLTEANLRQARLRRKRRDIS